MANTTTIVIPHPITPILATVDASGNWSVDRDSLSKFPNPERQAKIWERNLAAISVVPITESDAWDYNPSASGVFADSVIHHWSDFWPGIEVVADISDDPIFDARGVPVVF